jgi:hypothetical protein
MTGLSRFQATVTASKSKVPEVGKFKVLADLELGRTGFLVCISHAQEKIVLLVFLFTKSLIPLVRVAVSWVSHIPKSPRPHGD